METIVKKAVSRKDHLNESYLEVGRDDFKEICSHLFEDLPALLRVLFAADEREKDGVFRVYAVFSVPGDFFLAAAGGGVLSTRRRGAPNHICALVPRLRPLALGRLCQLFVRDHMNPRSSSQPTESHSRRIAPALPPSGWSTARDPHVTVEAPALFC